MSLEVIPDTILARFQIAEHRHACTILAHDCPAEFNDVMTALEDFDLLRSEIIAPGGAKTKIVERIERLFGKKGWKEEKSRIETIVNGVARVGLTHSIDLCKGRVACELQWNSKDGVFSRDLATLRLLHEIDVISVGIIITRCDELQALFKSLGYTRDNKPIAAKYGASTTHWSKLRERIGNSDAGMCPVLMIGIRKECYRDDIPGVPIILPARSKSPRKPLP